MDISTLLGLGASACLIAIALFIGGDAHIFINAPAILIVFGGCLGATLTNYTPKMLYRAVGFIHNVLCSRKIRTSDVVNSLLELSILVRKDGLSALEEEVSKIADPFLHKGVQLAGGGLEPSVISRIMENEIDGMAEREQQGVDLLNSLASYAPAMGLIGTVVGLVQMLNRMTDPSQIGASMAVALITTFYGVVLANLVFLPICGKFKQISQHRLRIMEMQMTGVVAICKGENPNVLKALLEGFQSSQEKEYNAYK